MRLICLLLLISFPAFSYLKPTPLASKTGIKAWFIEDKKTPLITLKFVFKNAGFVSDLKGKEGLAKLAVAMLSEGAGPHNHESFQKYLLDHGIQLSVEAGKDHVVFSFQTLKRKKEEGLKALRWILKSPKLEEARLNYIKEQYKVLFANLKHQPSYLAKKQLFQKYFNGHAYGRSEDMSETSIGTITTQDLKQYYDCHFTQDDLVIGLIGNMDAQEASRFLDDIFRSLPQEKKKIFKKTEPILLGQSTHIKQETPQSTVYFFQQGLDPADKDFLPFYLMLHILGSDSSSRLFQEVREKKGLVYTINAGPQALSYSPLLMGAFITGNKTLQEASDIVKSEWKKLAEKGVTEKELEKAKKALIGGYALTFQSSLSIASVLVSYQLYNRAPDYFQKREEMINSITLSQINALASKMIQPQNLTFVIVGPESLKGST